MSLKIIKKKKLDKFIFSYDIPNYTSIFLTRFADFSDKIFNYDQKIRPRNQKISLMIQKENIQNSEQIRAFSASVQE